MTIQDQTMTYETPLGAGGQLIKFDMADDGTKMTCGDEHGCWRRGPSDARYTTLFDVARIPAGIQTPGNVPNGSYNSGASYGPTLGCFDAVSCHGDSTKSALIFDGQVCLSVNSGAAYLAANIPRSLFDSNGHDMKSWQGHNITYRNDNANHMLVGTNGHDVYATTTGRTGFAALGVAAGSVSPGGNPSPHWTAYDPTSSGNRWWYTRYGTGILMSTTGVAGTYALIASMPAALATPVAMTVGADGALYAIGYLEHGILHKWTSGGGWTTITPADRYFTKIAVDPLNANHIFLSDGSNNAYTRDGGTTWMNWGNNLAAIPPEQISYHDNFLYLNVAPQQQMNVAINFPQFDPVVPERLWVSSGVDIHYVDLPTTGTGGSAHPLRWIGTGAGIEEAVVSSVVHPPGGVPNIHCWDLGTYRGLDRKNRYVNPQTAAYKLTDSISNGMRHPALVQPAMQSAYAADDPKWMAFLQHGGWFPSGFGFLGPKDNPHCGYSPDGGKTLIPFPTEPPGRPAFAAGGGSISVGLKGNVIIIWPYYSGGCVTNDYGNSWAMLGSPFVADTGSPPSFGFDVSGNGYWYPRFIVTYDAAGGYHYLHNFGNANALNPIGIWRSPTGAPGTWINRTTSIVAVSGLFGLHMKAVPVLPNAATKAGHIWLTPGNGGDAGGFTGQLHRSTDGAANFAAVTTNSGQTIENVTDIGFGAPRLPGGDPAVYYWGRVNGVFGFYRSDDYLASSVFITANPGGLIDFPSFICPDPDVYGQGIMGMSGSGAISWDANLPLNLAA